MHELVLDYFSEAPVITALGIVIFLTGLLHTFGGFRKISDQSAGQDDGQKREWSWDGFVLGVFEIILGAVLATAPLDRSDLTYLAASVWALVGGIVIIGDALRMRKDL